MRNGYINDALENFERMTMQQLYYRLEETSITMFTSVKAVGF